MENQQNNNILLKNMVIRNGTIVQENGNVLCNVILNGESVETLIPSKELVECGLLNLNCVPNLTPETTENHSSLGKGHTEDLEWNEYDSKLLLDKYNIYIDQVGPLKKFKTKKSMWIQISEDILSKLNLRRSGSQCENRFKTILKRKNKVVADNKISGNTRTSVEFEEEINKIKAKDDSIDPEILMGVGEVIINKKSNKNEESTLIQQISEPPKKKRKSSETSISQVLKEINEENQIARERRHREKMDLLSKLLKN